MQHISFPPLSELMTCMLNGFMGGGGGGGGGKHGNSSSLHPCTSAVHGELVSFFILGIICHKL